MAKASLLPNNSVLKTAYAASTLRNSPPLQPKSCTAPSRQPASLALKLPPSLSQPRQACHCCHLAPGRPHQREPDSHNPCVTYGLRTTDDGHIHRSSYPPCITPQNNNIASATSHSGLVIVSLFTLLHSRDSDSNSTHQWPPSL